MKKILLLMAIFFSVLLQAQLNTLSMNLPQGHPRYLTDAGGKETTLKLISNEPWAEEVFGKLKSKTDVYVRLTEAQPEWLLSRLAMYWESHATDVYVKGETFDYAGGEKAPVPTVRYTGHEGPLLHTVVRSWKMSFLTMTPVAMLRFATTLCRDAPWKVCTLPKPVVT